MNLIQVAVFANTFGKEFLSYSLTAKLPFTYPGSVLSFCRGFQRSVPTAWSEMMTWTADKEMDLVWFSLGVEADSESPGEVWHHSVQGEAVSHTLNLNLNLNLNSSKGSSIKLTLMRNIGMQLIVTGEQGILYQTYIMNANCFFRIQMGKHKRLQKP